MKIGIIGATGKAGSALYERAVERGHEAVAIVRDPAKAREMLGTDVRVIERDVFAITGGDLTGLDAVVNAFGTTPDLAHQHVELAQHLVEQTAGIEEAEQPRLAFVLGAGSLITGEDQHLFVEDIRQVPGAEAWVAIPENQLKQLEYLRTVGGVEWVGASPQATFAPGPATVPVIGDELLVASDGQSHTTTGTMAVALLDEIENPQHRNRRIAVGDA